MVFTDVLHADRSGSVRDFRLATVLAAVVPVVLSLYVSDMDVSRVVGLAFAVAASSFCPLLVLGIWWRGLTDVGAAAGVMAGGGAAMAAVLVTVLGPAAARLAGAAHRPAGRLDGAAGVHRHGGRVAGDQPPGPARRRRDHAPPARPRVPPSLTGCDPGVVVGATSVERAVT